MSFKINWDYIEKESFTQYAKDTLNEAMNSGKRPNILSDGIKIMDLNFGSIAPEFEILEIGDLGKDRFRGIFKFNYSGDASVTMTTKVSASLLKNYNANIKDHLMENCEADVSYNCADLSNFIEPNFIVSDCDFDIPLYVTLSSIKMSSIIVVVFSVSKGLTLVFKNEPLESIDVNSTFDKIRPIARFLQEKIETQIGELFREFLPGMLYKFSLEYTTKSFYQFHRSLNEEQEEEEPRVMLKDIDPDSPMSMSPGSLMRLTRLASSRQTLSLGGELSCDRMNSNLVTKAFANAILASSNSLAFSRLHMTDRDFSTGRVGEKVNLIKNIQARTFWKGNHGEDTPRRRVFHWSRHKKKEKVAGTQQKLSSLVPEDAISDGDDSTLVASDVIENKSVPMKLKTSKSSPSLSVQKRNSRGIGGYIHPTSRISSSLENTGELNEGAIPMSRGDGSGFSSSTATVIPTIDFHLRRASQYEQQQSEKQRLRQRDEELEELRRFMEKQKMASPKATSNIQNRKPSNTYHINKSERMKISRRIAKLDTLLSKKAEDDDALNRGRDTKNDFVNSTYGYPIVSNREAAFDSPPPPYSYS
ncbi:hypothetical protein HII13_000190 [Brettanomyces bruxellensis]|nr:hypothetical protein HII13_000190 [Brettanomyces bruxellensis]